MKRILFSIIAVFKTVASSGEAIPIHDGCFRKMNVLAGTVHSDSTTFDWSEEVMTDFNTQSVPILKRSCFSQIGDLHSFRIVMRGYDPRTNTLSESAGPSELGSCGNLRAPVYD